MKKSGYAMHEKTGGSRGRMLCFSQKQENPGGFKANKSNELAGGDDTEIRAWEAGKDKMRIQYATVLSEKRKGRTRNALTRRGDNQPLQGLLTVQEEGASRGVTPASTQKRDRPQGNLKDDTYSEKRLAFREDWKKGRLPETKREQGGGHPRSEGGRRQ